MTQSINLSNHLITDTDAIDQLLASAYDHSLVIRLHADNDILLDAHILKINFTEHWLYLSFPRAQAEQLSSLSSQQLTISTIFDFNYVEMQLTDVMTTLFEGVPALKAPLPEAMIKVQRRNHFRIQPPAHQPPICTVTLEQQPLELPVFDISASGVSLLAPLNTFDLAQHHMLNQCSLSLSDIQTIQISLQIVRQNTHTLPSGQEKQRIGCSFSRLSRTDQQRIEFYINQQQRLLIAKEKGLIY